MNFINSNFIPAHIAAVVDTLFDFTGLHTIDERINGQHEQLIKGAGYDHTYVVKSANSGAPVLAALAIGDKTGIGM